MSGASVLVDTPEPGIRTITFNRPDKRNALNIPLLVDFCDAIDAANADDSVRVIVLAGAGPAFCAGLDLSEARDPERSHESGELVARALKSIMRSPKATIAAVQGAAVAGGAGFMLACDIVVAADNFRTGFPEVRRGLVAGLVMTFLRRKIPEALARELLLTGKLIDAKLAHEAGLVNHIVPPEETMMEGMSVAREILRAAPGAVARTKRLFDDLYHRPVPEHVDHAVELHKDMRSSEEAQEGLAAFAEKRPPAWDPESGA